MAIIKGNYATLGVQDGNNTTATVSGAIVTTGHALLVAVLSWEGADTTPTVSDSSSNTWTLVGNAASAALTTYVYAVYNPTTSASHTAQFTPAAARVFKRCGFFSVQGSFQTSGSLVNAASTTTGNGTTIAAGTQTTTTPAIFVQWAANDNGLGFNASGSWASGDRDVNGAGRDIWSNVQASGTTWTNTLTIVAANNYSSVAMAFKETSASGQGARASRFVGQPMIRGPF